MARRNTGSTSNYITATPPTLALPLTLACWVKPANVTSNQNLICIAYDTTVYCVLTFDGANANGQGDNVVLAISNDGSTEAFGVSSAYNGDANRWIHCAARFGSATSRYAYLNGVPGSQNTTSKALTNTPIYSVIGAFYGGTSAFSPLNGEIAEVGIWDVALTDDEIYALSRPGTKPTDIRPQALRIYRSLDANESLPRSGIGLTGLAITGTMGVASQPFPPKQNNKKHVQFIKAAAGGGGSVLFRRTLSNRIGARNV